MFRAGIMGRELVGPFRVPGGVKMTLYLPWYKKKNRAFRGKIIFMHDSAPSRAAKNTSVSLAAMGIKGEKLMVWPPSSPDLNPIENLWSILKQKIYEVGRQFTSKQQLREAILTSCKDIQAETLQERTRSMDARIVKVISKKGSYVNILVEKSKTKTCDESGSSRVRHDLQQKCAKPPGTHGNKGKRVRGLTGKAQQSQLLILCSLTSYISMYQDLDNLGKAETSP
ncbi:hypothetical protein F2P81_009239 [Scophthalmus maximus]|uniref:Tc1-like transposase DDE domain-containing protein n=1 Tax=Scophthalmus maximus TaxID=52904 RepID=A0A6A4T121_SCOMX|nr:hypothetical protein F2P81_009239 [Scophthalmus maximus]